MGGGGRGRRDRDRMVVGFTTTYAISGMFHSFRLLSTTNFREYRSSNQK